MSRPYSELILDFPAQPALSADAPGAEELAPCA
jgi:hypothetical protein